VATVIDDSGTEVRATPVYRYPLPPRIPGRAGPRFNGNGQYVLPPCPDTGKTTGWTRASTVAKTLEDTYMLEKWAQRQILIGLQRSIALSANLEQLISEHLADGGDPATLAKDLRSPLNGIADTAQDVAESGRWAEFGTAVHAWTEWVDIGYGTIWDAPEVVRPWVIAHRRVVTEAGLRADPYWTERIVIVPSLGIAGTLDRLFWTADNDLVLGDVKTSRTMDYSWLYFAVQLAIYHSAKYVLSLDGMAWEPMPALDPDLALVSHLPREDAEAASVVPISMAYGREALAVSMLVRSLRTRADKEAKSVLYGVGLDDPGARRWHAARHRIELARTSAEMAEVWEEFQDVWDDFLTRIGHDVLNAATQTQRNAF
jgi:hypothetical protein